ncbi:hypothetical protein SprV_0501837200 [Sparganum proliferum]
MFFSVVFLRISYFLSLVTIFIAAIVALSSLVNYDSEDKKMGTFRAIFGVATAFNLAGIIFSAVAFKSDELKWFDIISCICYLSMLLLYIIGAGYFYGGIMHKVPMSVTWAIVSASMSLVLIPPVIARVLVLAK